MAVVKINAIAVPEGAGDELEKRFAARASTIKDSPGFLGFELLRPVSGDTRYFVVTRWESDEHFKAWQAGPSRQAHAGPQSQQPVATGSSLLEFEIVEMISPE
jgi:heme-degrading monooxygenase HmoA